MVFLIYVNNLPHSASCPTTLFAEDICLLIQDELVKIEKWMASNKSTINPNKCLILPILYSPQKSVCSLNVLISNEFVSPTSTAKNLDLTRDSQLMFDHHLLLLIKKLSRAAGFCASFVIIYLSQP